MREIIIKKNPAKSAKSFVYFISQGNKKINSRERVRVGKIFIFFFFCNWCGTLPYFSSTYTLHKNYTKMTFFWACLLGGGRIRDVASLIRRTDEPEIKKIFWGEKSEKTFSPEAKKIF